MPRSGLKATAEQDCISENVILGFFAGELEGERLLEVERHLHQCGACRRLIAVAGAELRSIGAHDWDVAAWLEGETEASVLLRSLRIVDETDYLVERELARGGMGRVLLATDRQGRTVAVKVLLGSGEGGMRRFLREMQITARLQHPSITALYEAGRWPSGEPFFAMKLVQGRTLREELAERPALRDRLALVPRVIAVTDALAYAHDQGIIHRDLKPSNILVGAFGETVVIDWGLAKARGGTGSEASQPSGIVTASSSHDTTEFGTPIGTPAYMAPEQARGDALDERADVYGLGALLYHVLSGRPPYIGPSAREVLAQVQGGPPPSLAKLMPELPPDLVAIVTQAMMPDAARRYASAQSMAEDLRRFAAGQLVSAHVYSVRALVRRWARKNRALVSVAAGLLALGILAGWASIHRIVEARNQAETERASATAHHLAAENLVNFLMTEFHDRALRADRLELLDGLGNQVLQYYRSIDQSGVPLDATTSSHRAMTLQVLAGLELDRRNLGNARALFQRALEFWQSADRGIETPAADLQQYGTTWQYYASLEDLEGNVDAALGAYQKAIDVADRMVLGDPQNLHGHLLAAASLGWMCEALRSSKGDLSASFEACNRGIARLEPLLLTHPNEAKLLSRLAFLNQLTSDRHLALGHLDEAAAAIQRSSELYLRVLNADPKDLRAAREYAYTFIYSGAVEIARGRLGAAVAAIDTNVERYEAIVREEPTNLANEDDLAVGYAYKCDFERRAARLDAAEAACRKAIALFGGHEDHSRENATRVSLLALVLTNLGRVEIAAHRHASATETLNAAAAASRRSSASDPASGTGNEQLLAALTWMVESELKLGRLAAADQHAAEALDLAGKLARKSSENSEIQNALGQIQTAVGDVALAERRPEEAASAYREARQTFGELLQRSPRVVDFQTGLARACAREADALDAARGAPSPSAQQLRHVARSILEELREAGRLYPEDAALLASVDARAPRTRRQVAISSP
jgi:tetratricopeptide (TPR) repeat protein